MSEEQLRFPVFDQPLPPPRQLSMDEYLEFVLMQRKLLFKQTGLPPEEPPIGRYVRFQL